MNLSVLLSEAVCQFRETPSSEALPEKDFKVVGKIRSTLKALLLYATNATSLFPLSVILKYAIREMFEASMPNTPKSPVHNLNFLSVLVKPGARVIGEVLAS